MNLQTKLTDEELADGIWGRNLLREILWPQQQELYDFFSDQKEKIVVLNCPRRFGKTFALLTFAIQMCKKHSGFYVKFGAATSVWADEIIHDIMPDILMSCPGDMLPVYKASKKRYIFNHDDGKDSELKIVGLDAKSGAGLRGTKANLVIIDEAGYVNKLMPLIESVALPLTRRMHYGKIFICSTPPEDASHDFFECIDRAHASDAYLKRDIYDDKIDGKEAIAEIIEIYTLRDENGNVIVPAEKNPSFQREYLCKRISNPDALIFPEFLMLKNTIVFDTLPEHYRPDYFDPIVAFDWGWTDYDGGLYGFADFGTATLYIEDETWTNYTLASDIGKMIKGKVAELWPGKRNFEDISFHADNDMKQIMAIRKETEIRFKPVDVQFDKDPTVNSMRTLMTNGRIRIHKRCKQLIYQLENGMWQMTRTGNRKNDFIRNKKVGHCDLLMAMLYMFREVNFQKNPQPYEQVTGQNIFGSRDKYRDADWDKLKGRRHGRANSFGR